jgi:hypothetical protein
MTDEPVTEPSARRVPLAAAHAEMPPAAAPESNDNPGSARAT